MKKITVFITISLFSIGLLAQKTDSSNIQLQNQTIENLDSLLNSYYVRKSYKTYSEYNTNVFNDNHNIDIADSIIIQRLKKIPTPIQLSYNEKVRSWINLYLKRGKYMVPTYLGLANYYFPMFEAELAANDMPLELKYLPIIESALNPRAVSRAGATGIWQFMYATGKRYGLEINSFVDQRRDPQQSTKAAVRYLKELYGIFGDWNLAIAAYNCGAANVNKAIARSGGKTNFWEIYNYLPRETRGYIPAFVAMTYIMNYPQEHNFYPAKIDLPLNTDTVMVTDTLHLLQVSKVLNIPMQQLRDLNPQYKMDIIPGFNKPYSLRLPIDKISSYLMLEDSIYNYKDSTISKYKLIVKNPPAYNPRNHNYKYNPRPCPTYKHTGQGKVLYTVKSGDTFSFIANWFDVSVRDLKCWNKIGSNRIRAGQTLILYEPLKKITYYQKMTKMSFEEKQNLANVKVVKRQKLDPNYIYYTIKTGDNLYIIAQKYDNVTYDDLLKINNFSDNQARKLQIGQVIKIKRKN